MCPCKLPRPSRYVKGGGSFLVVALLSHAINRVTAVTGESSLRNETSSVLSSSRVKFEQQHVLDI